MDNFIKSRRSLFIFQDFLLIILYLKSIFVQFKSPGSFPEFGEKNLF